MRCSACPTPLFTWEEALGRCRRHALDGDRYPAQVVALLDGRAVEMPAYRYDRMTALRELGSVLPPLPTRGAAVRVKHHVVVVPRVELTDAPEFLSDVARISDKVIGVIRQRE